MVLNMNLKSNVERMFAVFATVNVRAPSAAARGGLPPFSRPSLLCDTPLSPPPAAPFSGVWRGGAR